MAPDMDQPCAAILSYEYLEWEEVEGVVRPVPKKFVPTENTWGLLWGIWKAKVYYLNKHFNIGRQICDRAIEESRKLDSSQTLNDNIIRVITIFQQPLKEGTSCVGETSCGSTILPTTCSSKPIGIRSALDMEKQRALCLWKIFPSIWSLGNLTKYPWGKVLELQCLL